MSNATAQEDTYRAALAAFRDSLTTWQVPESAGGVFQTWSIAEDGSVHIHLPATLAANLGDELLEWEHRGDSWMDRADCQNWKRSPIARENRRESIVYGNVLVSMKCLLGRHFVKGLMDWARADKAAREKKEEDAAK